MTDNNKKEVQQKSWDKYFYAQGIENSTDLYAMRQQFAEFAMMVQGWLPDGRYKALVLTKLEEAAMFASKAMSHD